jgi:hypothetical protein
MLTLIAVLVGASSPIKPSLAAAQWFAIIAAICLAFSLVVFIVTSRRAGGEAWPYWTPVGLIFALLLFLTLLFGLGATYTKT